jgi:hypothetical protein
MRGIVGSIQVVDKHPANVLEQPSIKNAGMLRAATPAIDIGLVG